MTIFISLPKDKCAGDCIADKIADYCEAYLKSSKSCGTGKKCCISKDSEYNIDDIVIPTVYRNETFLSDKVSEPSNEDVKQKKKPKPNQKTSTSTSQSNSGEENSCKGECVAGLFALFCDDIDSDAFCPGEASCCVKNGDDANNYIEEKSTTTTMAPVTRTKPQAKSTKVSFSFYPINNCNVG